MEKSSSGERFEGGCNHGDFVPPCDAQESPVRRKRKAAALDPMLYLSEPRITGVACKLAYCGLKFTSEEELSRHYSRHLTEDLGKLQEQMMGIDRCPRIQRKTQDEILSGRRKAAFASLQNRRKRRQLRRGEGFDMPSEDASEYVCGVCDRVMVGDLSSFIAHYTLCLTGDKIGSHNEDVILEDIETFEWVGPTRIGGSSSDMRAILAGGSEFTTIQKTNEDEELDVTGGCREETYGPDQFTEGDILAVVKGEGEEIDHPSTSSESGSHSGACDETRSEGNYGSPGLAQVDPPSHADSGQVLSPEDTNGQEGEANNASKTIATPSAAMLKKLTASLSNSSSEEIVCKICMAPYRRPTVSVNCWHVHCESCWFLSLNAKKLCPQCKVIVQPGDLRKIYL